jgi:hypothetical protein
MGSKFCLADNLSLSFDIKELLTRVKRGKNNVTMSVVTYWQKPGQVAGGRKKNSGWLFYHPEQSIKNYLTLVC